MLLHPTTVLCSIRGGFLKKASEYHQHAEECRVLARNAANNEQRTALEKMAQTWESLAQDRERHVAQTTRMAARDSKDSE